jgi:TonB family protein
MTPPAQSSTGGIDTRSCQLKTVEPTKIAFPKKTSFRGLNRFPMVSFDVDADGNVSNVELTKGTKSPKIDKAIEDQVKQWKYAASPGCGIREVSMKIIIELK